MRELKRQNFDQKERKGTKETVKVTEDKLPTS